MLDIDHFKHFNDTNGHEAGDEVLKFIANKLKENVGEDDIACRFGGEEFMVVLVNTDLNNTISRIQRIRDEIKQTHLFFHDKPLKQITISVGISEAPTHGKTTQAIIRAADQALYAAKEAGRDRINIFNYDTSLSK